MSSDGVKLLTQTLYLKKDLYVIKARLSRWHARLSLRLSLLE